LKRKERKVTHKLIAWKASARRKPLLLRGARQVGKQLSAAVTQMVNNEMYNYFIVGGMPECVSAFINTGSILEAINIQTELIATYRQDFSKYAGHGPGLFEEEKMKIVCA
jgi:predicted AAA+ superfamily ATPase